VPSRPGRAPGPDPAFTTVDRIFDKGQMEKNRTHKRARTADQALAEGGHQTARHRAWMTRGTPSAASWRPKRFYRVASRRGVLNLDRQLKFWTSWGGLSFFQYNDKSDLWSDWRTYPWLGQCGDSGPDNICGFGAQERGFDINTDFWPDGAHGANRSEECTLRSTGLFEFWLLNLVDLNCSYGMNKTSNTRRHQEVEAMEDNFEMNTCASAAIFQSLGVHIKEELERTGVALPHEGSLEEETYNYCKAGVRYGRNGYRCNLNRFQGGVSASEDSLDRWYRGLWERLYIGLELDMLPKARFTERLKLRVAAAAAPKEGERAETAADRLTLDDRAIRKVSGNAIQISVAYRSDPGNRRLLTIAVGGFKPTKNWHTRTQQTLRCVDNAEKYIVNEIGKGYMEHVLETVELLKDRRFLKDADFVVDVTDCARLQDSYEYKTENDFADVVGQLVMTHASERTRRWVAQLCGYPWSFYKAFAHTCTQART
jgi:hypothetical protein